VVQFVWRHSIARRRKPPVIRKDLRDICHISRFIADFAPNFVAMATGVGRSRICLASFNSPTPKPPVIRKDLRDICYISRVIADFVPNFVAMATGVGRRRISRTMLQRCVRLSSVTYVLWLNGAFCRKTV